jgi:hypothetical protein
MMIEDRLFFLDNTNWVAVTRSSRSSDCEQMVFETSSSRYSPLVRPYRKGKSITDINYRHIMIYKAWNGRPGVYIDILYIKY